ncbi:MAG: hypothetical protein M1822_006868 [Bathelium mastoideum]|nr:MAG: hypothetical protein M1822_006868 [Bathelium mastoideum]
MADFALTIESAIAEDVTLLTNVFMDGFADDVHTQMKTTGQNKDKFANGMREATSVWIQDHSRYTVLKATDDGTKQIVGWICWATRGYEDDTDRSRRKEYSEKHAAALLREAQTSGQDQLGNTTKLTRPHEQILQSREASGSIQQLESLTSEHLQRWMTKVMPPGTICMYIVALVVHPSYQSRGAGSALIGWGTARADADAVFCWVHSSESGHRAFAKNGFKVVESLQVDLDEFSPGPCPVHANGKWGQSTFRYMIRPPHD